PGVPGRFFPRVPGLDDGHALTGPVFVRGADPGLTLEVELLSVQPGNWGWSSTTSQRMIDKLGLEPPTDNWMFWHLDTKVMIGRNQHGHVIKLRPFMGVLGMPPNEAGVRSTTPPRNCGGNIDCKE